MPPSLVGGSLEALWVVHQENNFYSQADLNHLITPTLLQEASVCPGAPRRVLEIVNLRQGAAGPSACPHNFT